MLRRPWERNFAFKLLGVATRKIKFASSFHEQSVFRVVAIIKFKSASKCVRLCISRDKHVQDDV